LVKIINNVDNVGNNYGLLTDELIDWKKNFAAGHGYETDRRDDKADSSRIGGYIGSGNRNDHRISDTESRRRITDSA